MTRRTLALCCLTHALARARRHLLTGKELQARAIAAGLKANAKSADIIKALEHLSHTVNAGAELLVQPAALQVLSKANANQRGTEASELEELAALGIKGRTPGGGKWRQRVVAHTYNLRSTAAPEVEASEVEVA